MNDYLVRIIAKQTGVRAIACVTTQLANEAASRHATSPAATSVLARALTAGALMGSLLKIQQRVALKFEGTGSLQKLLVEADSYGKVRGYVGNPNAELPFLYNDYDIVNGIGQAGLLTVVKDVRLKELVRSVVPLETSTIDGDLTAYLELSEQIPSEVTIDVAMQADGSVAMSGGVLIQSMPPDGSEVVQHLRDKLQELPPLGVLLQHGNTPEDVLALLFAEMEYEVLEQRPLLFKCSCSRARSEKALRTLSAIELSNILNTEGQAIVDCHFCHERYIFNENELESLLTEIE